MSSSKKGEMINVLGIGLDYLMLVNEAVRGDVRERQIDYAKFLGSLTLIVYAPRNLRLKNEKWRGNLQIFPTNSRNKICFVFDALKIGRKICREKKIDAITTEDPFTTGLVGYLLKKKFNIPLNVQAHIDFCDNEYWMGLRKINRVFNRVGKFILRKADTIRVGTNQEKKKLLNLGVPEDRIFVVPVNSNLEKFKNVNGDVIRREYLNGKFDKILLFTGRLVPQKDIPTLFKAFRIVIKEKPATVLLIVGSGYQENFLKKLAGELEIEKNVVFRGPVEHRIIPEYLSACDIYVVSSIFEGTCIAMAEAMAAGKPVVATRFAGACDLLVEGKSGFIVEQKDYRVFAERIIYLLNHPEKVKEMGNVASLRIEEIFSGNRNIERMISLWEETAHRSIVIR